MKKVVLYATIFLLITSTLLVTATAKKPQPDPKDPIYTVTFTGDIQRNVDLFCRDRGKKWDLYGYVDLTFVGDVWQYSDFDWRDTHFCGIRIFISKETNEVMDMFFDFDTQPVPDTEYKYFLYSLRGPNSDGTYDISEIFIERSGRGKKGSLSISGIYITSLELDFVVTVDS